MGAGGRCAGSGGRWAGASSLWKGSQRISGPGTAHCGAPRGVAGARPVQDQPSGVLPTSPGLAPPSSPRAPGEPRPPAGAAAGTRWHHESPPGRVAGLGEGRGGGGVGDTGQPPRQKEGARSPRVPLNDKPPRHRLPMVTAVSPLALISEPPQPRLRDRQQARACTDLRGPRPFPWPPQRTGSG